jgi:hypothetical protein
LFERARRDADGLLVIAPDGEVLRGAWTDANDKVTLFSAMICGKGVTVAQPRVPDGANEITQVEPVLAGLATDPGQPVVVALDAAHTQRETAEHLKGEAGLRLHHDRQRQPAHPAKRGPRKMPAVSGRPARARRRGTRPRPHQPLDDLDRRRGRDRLPPHRPGRRHPPRRPRPGRRGVSKEYALVITSAATDRIGPADLHTHSRGHWGIKNKSHYVRDTVWREDANQAYAR